MVEERAASNWRPAGPMTEVAADRVIVDSCAVVVVVGGDASVAELAVHCTAEDWALHN